MLSSHGYRELVRVILADHRVDVNAQVGVFGDALQVASIHEHRAIVQMLVEHGSVRGSYSLTAIVSLMLTSLLSLFCMYTVYFTYFAS